MMAPSLSQQHACALRTAMQDEDLAALASSWIIIRKINSLEHASSFEVHFFPRIILLESSTFPFSTTSSTALSPRLVPDLTHYYSSFVNNPEPL
eukprot:m.171805 g.171805  ORF g.171805 m.171805 type:complete len:94 (-) comp15356_c0_seq1:666-947(-)